MLAAMLGLLLQAGPPVVTTSTDRARLAVGEQVVLTVRATSLDPRAVTILLPPVQGFALVSRLERTGPAAGGADSTATTLELTLRAMEPGHFTLGPVRAVQGRLVGEAPGEQVDVARAADLLATTNNPRLKAMLQQVAPPRKAGDVALRVIVSAGTARVGEQVDVLAAAWFPRELRLQLRRPPVLQPPVIGGVWALQQAAPGGLATSRLIGGEWYDLFISHQTIFPLAPGTVVIPAAALRYSVPVALQFLSQEESYELKDGPRQLTVLPLPAAGRPAGFPGAVGHGLALERSVATSSAQVGEAVRVEITVRGEGNVSLWPAPTVAWPSDVRAYVDNTEDHQELVNGRVGGEKRFRYVVVPSRPGALTLPALRYAYFDPGTNRYEDATLPAGTLPVRAASLARGDHAPLPLVVPPGTPWPAAMAGRVPPRAALAVLLLAPVAALLVRRRRPRAAAVAPVAPDPVLRLERLLVAVAGGHRDVPLRTRLHAAGVDDASATRLIALMDALTAARYGPRGSGVPPSLAAEATALAAVLEPIATRRRGVRRVTSAATAGLLLVAVASARAALAPSPAQLYRDGAYAAAAEGFAAAAAVAPTEPAAWYGLGAARLASGDDDVGALTAFTRAARLAPRDGAVASAVRRMPSPDPETRRARWVSPVTPAELAIAGALLWLVAWGLVGAGVRWSWSAPAVAVAALLLAAAGGVHWWYGRPVALARETLTLRSAPHGRGDAVGEVPRATVVELGEARGGWRLVRAEDGRLGWVARDALAPLTDD